MTKAECSIALGWKSLVGFPIAPGWKDAPPRDRPYPVTSRPIGTVRNGTLAISHLVGKLCFSVFDSIGSSYIALGLNTNISHLVGNEHRTRLEKYRTRLEGILHLVGNEYRTQLEAVSHSVGRTIALGWKTLTCNLLRIYSLGISTGFTLSLQNV